MVDDPARCSTVADLTLTTGVAGPARSAPAGLHGVEARGRADWPPWSSRPSWSRPAARPPATSYPRRSSRRSARADARRWSSRCRATPGARASRAWAGATCSGPAPRSGRPPASPPVRRTPWPWRSTPRRARSRCPTTSRPRWRPTPPPPRLGGALVQQPAAARRGGAGGQEARDARAPRREHRGGPHRFLTRRSGLGQPASDPATDPTGWGSTKPSVRHDEVPPGRCRARNSS